ncbi:MAG: hypothetical protein JWN45_1349 [Acidobacteriaceae bacterium]|nr:hypothetical protein [Acidobacteriaceae bacterium]
MKLNLRSATWGLATVFAVASFGMPSFVAAQSEQGMEHGRGHNKDNKDNGDEYNNENANNKFFQQGLSQRQTDHANNRGRKYRSRPRNTNDRQAYQSGYDQGYTNYNNQNGQNWHNGQYGANGQYGNSNNNPGFRMGSQDGTNDGRSDRASGRPLKYGPGYNHPDRGYDNSYGDKNAYKQQYMLGYQQGYQQAYGNQRQNR